MITILRYRSFLWWYFPLRFRDGVISRTWIAVRRPMNDMRRIPNRHHARTSKISSRVNMTPWNRPGIGKKRNLGCGPFLHGNRDVGLIAGCHFFRKSDSLGTENSNDRDQPSLGANVLAHFIKRDEQDTSQPEFPFTACWFREATRRINWWSLIRYGRSWADHDDAAGEAFAKCAKEMGFGYYSGRPGGRRLANLGIRQV